MEPAKVISIKLSTFSHATEDEQKVLRAIRELYPDEFPRKVETAKVRGHHGNEIIVSRVKVGASVNADRFFISLWSHLSPANRREVTSRIEDFVDKSGTLHIRIGKQESFHGEVILQESDPIKVEVQFDTRGPPSEPLIERIKSRLAALSDVGLASNPFS